MIYRATQICSSYIALHDAFEFIRSIAIKNGYPNSIVDSITKRQLNLIYNPPNVTPPTPSTNDTVVLRISYFETLCQVYAKRILRTAQKTYPQKEIRVIYDIKERVGDGFTSKDLIPEPMQAGVVYEAICSDCKMNYIGKTFRRLKIKIHEHLNDQKNDLCLKKINKNMPTSKPIQIIKPNIQRKGRITRSQTGKLQPLKINLNIPDIGELLKHTKAANKNSEQHTHESSITKHYFTTGHTFINSDFHIRLKEKHKNKLFIKESLLIRTEQPELNRGDRFIPVFVYPDGIDLNNNTNKQ